MSMRPRPWARSWILLAATGLACDGPPQVEPPRVAVASATATPSPAPAPNTPKPAPDEPKATEKKAEAPKPAKRPDVPVGIAEAKKRAVASANGGNLDAAVKLLREGLQSSPNDHEGLFLISLMIQGQGMEAPEGKPKLDHFLESAQFGRKLLDLHKKDLSDREQSTLAQVFYNEACALALGGKAEDAKTSLELASTLGFEDLELLDKDKDIEAIRKLPGFDAFKKTLVARADASIKAKAQAELSGFKSFPFDFNLKTIDDKPLKLADLKGKVAIVNIWGTWCPPCREEIPHFKELYGKYKDKGLEIVGINYENEPDPKDAIKTIKTFTDKVPIPYPLVIGDEATQNRVPNFEGFPTTLFIDREGNVRLKLVGYTPMPRLDAIVRTLLDEKK